MFVAPVFFCLPVTLGFEGGLLRSSNGEKGKLKVGFRPYFCKFQMDIRGEVWYTLLSILSMFGGVMGV